MAYTPASVCENGHVFALTAELWRALAVEPDEEPEHVRCPKCGKLVLIECPWCEAPIRGSYTRQMRGNPSHWERPDFRLFGH